MLWESLLPDIRASRRSSSCAPTHAVQRTHHHRHHHQYNHHHHHRHHHQYNHHHHHRHHHQYNRHYPRLVNFPNQRAVNNHYPVYKAFSLGKSYWMGRVYKWNWTMWPCPSSLQRWSLFLLIGFTDPYNHTYSESLWWKLFKNHKRTQIQRQRQWQRQWQRQRHRQSAWKKQHMLYFWNPDDLLIPNMMIDTSPWSSCSRRSPWLPCSGHTISSTGPSVSPFWDFLEYFCMELCMKMKVKMNELRLVWCMDGRWMNMNSWFVSGSHYG